MRVKIFFSVFLFFLVAGTAVAQNPDIQKMLNSANAYKKNLPDQKNKNEGLPAGYENNWKVMVTVSRTAIGATEMSSSSGACKYTKTGSMNFTISSDFSSDSMIAQINGDDFTLIANPDNKLKPYIRPFKGKFDVTSNASYRETSCDESSTTQYTGGTNIDAAGMRVNFTYNSKSKKGSFQISLPSDYTIQASGKSISKSKGNRTITVDASNLGKASIGSMLAMCGIFQSWNYPVSKNANYQQTLQSSPVNGGMASIGLTNCGYDISYSESKTVEGQIPGGWTGSDKITFTTNVQILITNQAPPEYDAIVQTVNYPSLLQTDDYKKWIPEGPPIPDTAQHDKKPSADQNHGNSIAFRVYIVDKKRPDLPLPGRKFKVEYMLNSSKIKGICMNYPQDKDADTKPDLIFDSLLQKNPEKGQDSYKNDLLKSKNDSGENFIAIITSYDYGSYGSLKIKVTVQDCGVDKPPIWAHFKDDKKDTIFIPYDDNHNHIADEWEKQMGILGKNLAANSDDDDLPNDLNKDYKGDGYTAYEEYRGFSEEAKHIRTDPTTRDVMVCNRLKNKTDEKTGIEKNYHDRAEDGFALYKGVTGIEVHYKFRPEEFGRKISTNPDQKEFNDYSVKDPFLYDKVLNFNDENENGDKVDHSVDQHGILVAQSTLNDGACAAVQKAGGDDIGPPGNYAFLYIAEDFDPSAGGYAATRANVSQNGNVTFNPNGKGKVITDYFAVTVAHEMLHCSNVPHHGDHDLEKPMYRTSEDGQSIICTAEEICCGDDDHRITKKVRLVYRGREILPNDQILDNPKFIDTMYRSVIGVQQGETSGNEDCIMRYSVANIVEKNGTHTTLPVVKDFKPTVYKENGEQKKIEYTTYMQSTGTSLCTEATGTGINGRPNYYFGNATNGNCKQKVKVNDKK
jgi:hypothetical protein